MGDEIHDSHHLTNRERHRIDHDNAKTERAEDINNKYHDKISKKQHRLEHDQQKKIDKDHQRQKKNEQDEIHDSHHLTNRERHRIDHDNAKTERAEDINNKYHDKISKKQQRSSKTKEKRARRDPR